MDEFMGGGTKSFPFDNIGDTVTGVVVGLPEKLQQTDFEGKLKFWDNGQPKWMYRITLQTDVRDPGDPYDDGIRNIYVKWMSLKAVQNAVKSSGARSIEMGGILSLTFSGVGQKKPGMPQPPKEWVAQYLPPQGDFMDNGSSAPAPVPTSPVTYTQPAQPVPVPVSASPAQRSVLERMRDQAAAARAGAPLPPPPVHHGNGEPPF